MNEALRKIENIADYGDSFMDEELLDLYENAPCGYISVMADGIVVRANNTFCDLTGFAKIEIERNMLFVDFLSDVSLSVFDADLDLSDVSLELKSIYGETIPVLINTSKVLDSHGVLRFYRMSLFDMSERKKYEMELYFATKKAEAYNHKLKVVADFSQKINESIDYVTTLSNITSLICSEVADGCLVDLFRQGFFVRSAAEHYLPEKNQNLGLLNFPLLFRKAHESKEKVIFNDLEQPIVEESLLLEIEELKFFGVKALAIFPLISRGHTVGLITFLSTEFHKHFNEDDLILIESLLGHMTSAIQKSKMFDKISLESKMRDHVNNLSNHEIRTPLTSIKLQLQSALKKIDQCEGTSIKKLDVENLLRLLNRHLDTVCKSVEKMSHLNQINKSLDLTLKEMNLSEFVLGLLEQMNCEF